MYQPPIRCSICREQPSEISEYIYAAEEEGITPEEYVVQQEGTYNPEYNTFYCTECYCNIGMPRGKAGKYT